jgi:hypothetical protein
MKRRWFIAAIAAATLIGGGAGVLSQSGRAGAGAGASGVGNDPKSLGSYFLGQNMARAEIVLKVGNQVHDYRIDQGRVVTVRPGALDLVERDGTKQSVPMAVATRVSGSAGESSVQQLRPGTHVIAIRDGSGPATSILVVR